MHYRQLYWELRGVTRFAAVRRGGERYKDPRRLELEPVRGTGRLVVLQVDGAAGRRRGQVDVVLCEQVLVLRDPVAEHVGVVGWNDSYL